MFGVGYLLGIWISLMEVVPSMWFVRTGKGTGMSSSTVFIFEHRVHLRAPCSSSSTVFIFEHRVHRIPFLWSGREPSASDLFGEFECLLDQGVDYLRLRDGGDNLTANEDLSLAVS
jgi:hypothetical protein